MSFGRDGTFGISYSGRKIYLECPKQYEFRYIKKPSIERDISSSIVGSTIGVIFEWFYNREIWKSSNVYEELADLIDPALRQAYKNSKHDFNHDAYSLYNEDLKALIKNGLSIIRSNRLLKDENSAEVDLTVLKRHGDLIIKLVGYADFILRDSREIIIIDGKAVADYDKYTDPEQLIWYGLQHYMKYRVSPDKLGFLFWRNPENPLKWIDFNEDDYRNSLRTTLKVVDNIINKKFQETPSSKCKLCTYRPICDVGNQYITDMDFKSGRNILENSIFDIEKF